MPVSKRRRPRVYLDSSCFGRALAGPEDAFEALQALLSEIKHRQLEFVSSAWLKTELRQIEPRSARLAVLGLVPDGIWVQWDTSLAKTAREWVIRLRLDTDESGEPDCRHVACALRGGARFLITHDARFYEAMRQGAKLLAPLRPAPLVGWQGVVFEDQG